MSMWPVVSYLTLIGEVIMLVFAIIAYRAKRTLPFALLMWAFVCFVIARSSWFTFGVVGGFITRDFNKPPSVAVFEWQQSTDIVFELLFVVLAIFALSCLRRQHRSATKSGV